MRLEVNYFVRAELYAANGEPITLRDEGVLVINCCQDICYRDEFQFRGVNRFPLDTKGVCDAHDFLQQLWP